MSKLKDETGNVYGRLTVLYRAPDKIYGSKKKVRKVCWHCICECGNKCDVIGESLRQGLTKSCGCYNYECQKDPNLKHHIHGMRNTRLYDIWRGMKKRCYLVTNDNYKDYGTRGITVCDEWKDNFENFANWAYENGYQEDLTIDRIDNDGNYSPENCRWATNAEQQRNKRNNHLITFNNETYCLSEWSEITGHSRYFILYWERKGDLQKALTPNS